MTSPQRYSGHHLHDRLTAAELQSAALDGELVRLGSGYAGIDEPEGPRDRARSISGDLADERAIVCDRTAAWVWGWAPCPVALSTCVSITARVASPVRRRLRVREAVLEHDEVVLLDGVRVTTPVRTVIDLARHDADESVIAVVAAALAAGAVNPSALRTALHRRPGIAYLRRATARVEAAITRC